MTVKELKNILDTIPDNYYVNISVFYRTKKSTEKEKSDNMIKGYKVSDEDHGRCVSLISHLGDI